MFRRTGLWISILSLVFLLAGCGKSNEQQNASALQSKKVVGVKEHNQGRIADTLSIARDSLLANIKRQQVLEEKKAQKHLAKEALTAIQETQKAIIALDKGDKEQALKDMEMVLGKLEILLERNPDLALVPIDASSQVINLISDLNKIEALHKRVKELVDKCIGLRIFDDSSGRMNLSLKDVQGEALIVSQFTLYGDCKKGKRPSYTGAAHPDHAIPLYELFIETVKNAGIPTQTGQFGAMMDVALINNGPVSLLVEV